MRGPKRAFAALLLFSARMEQMFYTRKNRLVLFLNREVNVEFQLVYVLYMVGVKKACNYLLIFFYQPSQRFSLLNIEMNFLL